MGLGGLLLLPPPQLLLLFRPYVSSSGSVDGLKRSELFAKSSRLLAPRVLLEASMELKRRNSRGNGNGEGLEGEE